MQSLDQGPGNSSGTFGKPLAWQLGKVLEAGRPGLILTAMPLHLSVLEPLGTSVSYSIDWG